MTDDMTYYPTDDVWPTDDPVLTTILTRRLQTLWNPHKQGLSNAKPHKHWLAGHLDAGSPYPCGLL